MEINYLPLEPALNADLKVNNPGRKKAAKSKVSAVIISCEVRGIEEIAKATKKKGGQGVSHWDSK